MEPDISQVAQTLMQALVVVVSGHQAHSRINWKGAIENEHCSVVD